MARTGVLLVTLALGACAIPDFDSFRAPDSTSLFRPLSVTNVRDRVLPAVTAEDMVDAEGRCAGVAASAPPADGNPPADPNFVPLVPSGVALDMTECEVVKRAGAPEKVDLGTNERSERTATLTYIHGPRPGIYHFTAGRLASMERAPEPPPPPKPARPQKRAPKPASKPAQTAGR
jgi:hypothetical protein